MHTSVGIDVGKSRLHVSFPCTGHPKTWQVVILDFEDNPLWHQELAALIADDPSTVVACEPTGWHYLVPVISVITQLTRAQLWLVKHSLTGNVRAAQIAAAKTDHMDARALALIAKTIHDHIPPRGVRHHNVQLEEQVQALRILVNDHARITKQAVRCQNQLQQYAHSITPQLAIKFKTWLPLAMRGFITPRQLAEYVAALPADRDRRKTWAVERLSAAIPLIEPPITAVRTIQRLCADLDVVQLQQQTLLRDIETIIFSPPFDTVSRRWLTMPVANIIYIAALHIASHGEVLTMHHVDEFVSSLAINPLSMQSGNDQRAQRAVGGYRPALNALFNWTMSLLSPKAPPNPIADSFHKHKARGKQHSMRAARAKLASILYGVAHSPAGYQAPTLSKPITNEGDPQ